jgi:hypothetical protein
MRGKLLLRDSAAGAQTPVISGNDADLPTNQQHVGRHGLARFNLRRRQALRNKAGKEEKQTRSSSDGATRDMRIQYLLTPRGSSGAVLSVGLF